MGDDRFSGGGSDARFPGAGTDARFPGGGADARFPGGGVDARFDGDGAFGGAYPPAALFANSENGFDRSYIDPSFLSTNLDGSGLGSVVLGDAIAYVEDSSGNGHHLIQDAETARPKLGQAPDGRYRLEFDGIDDYFYLPAPAFNLIDHHWWMAVEQVAHPVNQPGYFSFTDGAIDNDFSREGAMFVGSREDSNRRIYQAGNVNNGVMLAEYNGTLPTPLGVYEGDKSATRMDLYANGTLAGSDTTFAAFNATHGGNFLVGARYSGQVEGFNEMNLYGLILRCAPTTPAEAAAARAYMADRAGVTL